MSFYHVNREVNMRGTCTSAILTVLMLLIHVSALTADPPDTTWTCRCGGFDFETGMCVKQTSDGGYIIAGECASPPAVNTDGYLVKTDANGDTMWTRNIGGNDYDIAQPIYQLADDGYIFAGYTLSPPAIGGADVWLVRTDSLGNVLWDTTYHRLNWDVCWRMNPTPDGGYILGCGCDQLGIPDLWIIKTDSVGNIEWDTTYGGPSAEFIANVHPADGGYFVTAGTMSYGPSGINAWLIRIDSIGNVLWDSVYGGSQTEDPWDSRLTHDGGVIICGGTDSATAGNFDIYLHRVDAQGHTLWSGSYGGAGEDYAYGMSTTADSCYVMAGYTRSFGANANDLWVIKVDDNGSQRWALQYGGLNGTRDQQAWWIEQLPDESYIISGHDQIGLMDTQLLLVKTGPDPGVEEFTSSTPIANAFTVSPNPFTTYTDIRCQITDDNPEFGIEIYDIAGRLIMNLSEQISVIGHQLSVNWNGRDQENRKLATGVYFVKFTVGDNTATKKLLLIQ
jgi:hypothetical protein